MHPDDRRPQVFVGRFLFGLIFVWLNKAGSDRSFHIRSDPAAYSPPCLRGGVRGRVPGNKPQIPQTG